MSERDNNDNNNNNNNNNPSVPPPVMRNRNSIPSSSSSSLSARMTRTVSNSRAHSKPPSPRITNPINRSMTEGEEPVDQTINKPPLAMPVKSLMWIPAYGDIVWVQTLSSFPFWPACVMDPSTLPTETQAMTAALLRVSSSNNSARVSPATVKKALFLYGSAHYDFATPLQMRDYASNREALNQQAVTGSFSKILPQAIALADKELLLPPHERVAWVKIPAIGISHPPTSLSVVNNVNVNGGSVGNSSYKIDVTDKGLSSEGLNGKYITSIPTDLKNDGEANIMAESNSNNSSVNFRSADKQNITQLSGNDNFNYSSSSIDDNNNNNASSLFEGKRNNQQEQQDMSDSHTNSAAMSVSMSADGTEKHMLFTQVMNRASTGGQEQGQDISGYSDRMIEDNVSDTNELNIELQKDITNSSIREEANNVSLFPANTQEASLFSGENQQSNFFPLKNQEASLIPVKKQEASLFPVKNPEVSLFPAKNQETCLFPVKNQEASLFPVKKQEASLFSTKNQEASLFPMKEKESFTPKYTVPVSSACLFAPREKDSNSSSNKGISQSNNSFRKANSASLSDAASLFGASFTSSSTSFDPFLSHSDAGASPPMPPSIGFPPSGKSKVIKKAEYRQDAISLFSTPSSGPPDLDPWSTVNNTANNTSQSYQPLPPTISHNPPPILPPQIISVPLLVPEPSISAFPPLPLPISPILPPMPFVQSVLPPNRRPSLQISLHHSEQQQLELVRAPIPRSVSSSPKYGSAPPTVFFSKDVVVIPDTVTSITSIAIEKKVDGEVMRDNEYRSGEFNESRWHPIAVKQGGEKDVVDSQDFSEVEIEQDSDGYVILEDESKDISPPISGIDVTKIALNTDSTLADNDSSTLDTSIVANDFDKLTSNFNDYMYKEEKDKEYKVERNIDGKAGSEMQVKESLVIEKMVIEDQEESTQAMERVSVREENTQAMERVSVSAFDRSVYEKIFGSSEVADPSVTFQGQALSQSDSLPFDHASSSSFYFPATLDQPFLFSSNNTAAAVSTKTAKSTLAEQGFQAGVVVSKLTVPMRGGGGIFDSEDSNAQMSDKGFGRMMTPRDTPGQSSKARDASSVFDSVPDGLFSSSSSANDASSLFSQAESSTFSDTSNTHLAPSQKGAGGVYGGSDVFSLSPPSVPPFQQQNISPPPFQQHTDNSYISHVNDTAATETIRNTGVPYQSKPIERGDGVVSDTGRSPRPMAGNTTNKNSNKTQTTSSSSTSNGMPPSAPGVKTKAAPTKANVNTAHSSIPSHSHAPTPVPEGMMPTPHGFVNIKKKAIEAPTTTARQHGDLAPLHIAKERETGTDLSRISESSAVRSYVSGGGAQARRNYGRPPCACVSFGFGGQVAIMLPIPKVKHLLNPLLVTADDAAKPFLSGAVTIHRVIDLMTAYHASPLSCWSLKIEIDRQELGQFIDLLHAFPEPLLVTGEIVNVKTKSSGKEKDPSSSSSSASLLVNTFLSSKLERQKQKEVEKEVSSRLLLLLLIKVLVDTQGSVHSTVSSPSSPENRIVQLLLNGPSDATPTPSDSISIHTAYTRAESRALYSLPVSTSIENTREMSKDNDKSEFFASLESVLLSGHREEAARLAVAHNEWPIALLIASNCGADKYREVAKAYAVSTFPACSPLHLATLLFSNQAASALQYGDKRLSSTSSATQESSLLSLWRRNLSMILANKGPDWRALVVALGDRLLKEVRDVDSAHFAYLCSGLLPFTNSSSNGSSSNSSTSFGLLGLEVNSHDGKKRAVTLSDCPSLFALRLTEILEWTLSKEKESTDSAVVASSGVGSSLSKSLGGLFGLGVAIDKEKTSASAPSGVDARVLAMRSVLCPLKVRWALLLADYGDIKGAGAYAREAKGLIGMCLDKQSASNSKAGKGQNQAPSRSVHVPSFCRQLVFSLEEFLDRLGGFEGKDAASISPVDKTGGKEKSVGLWGMLGSISSASLKDLVDPPPPAPSSPTPSSQLGKGHGNSMRNNIPMPIAPSSRSGSAPNSNNNISGNSSIDQQQQQQPGPYPTNANPSYIQFPPQPYGQKGQGQSQEHAYTHAPSPRGVSSSYEANNNTNTNNSLGSSGKHSSNNLSSLQETNFSSSTSFSSSSSAPYQDTPNLWKQPQQQHHHHQQQQPPQYQQHYQRQEQFNSQNEREGGEKSSGSMNNLQQDNDANINSNSSGFYVPPSYTTAGGEGGGGFSDVDLNNSTSKVIGQEIVTGIAFQPQPLPKASPKTSTGWLGWGSGSAAAAVVPVVVPTTTSAAGNNTSMSANPSSSYLVGDSYPSPAKTATPAPSPLPSAPNSTSPSGKTALPPSVSSGGLIAAPPSTAVAAAGPGMVGKVRKNLLNWLYPDAHDANDNMGGAMEAYYDKLAGKWIIPGEEGNNDPDPADLPPPTGLMNNHSTSALPSHGSGLSLRSSSSSNGGGGGGSNSGPPSLGGYDSAPAIDEPYDPLAAMMAPPKRAVSYAQMPPQSQSQGSFSFPPLGQGGGQGQGQGGKPITLMSGPPSNVTMWQPKPSASVSVPYDVSLNMHNTVGGDTDIGSTGSMQQSDERVGES